MSFSRNRLSIRRGPSAAKTPSPTPTPPEPPKTPQQGKLTEPTTPASLDLKSSPLSSASRRRLTPVPEDELTTPSNPATLSVASTSLPISPRASSNNNASPSTAGHSTGFANAQPPWDRSVEVSWTRQTPPRGRAEPADALTFQKNYEKILLKSVENPKIRMEELQKTAKPKKYCYLGLPHRVRFMIMKHILSHDQDTKSIRINDSFLLGPIWLRKDFEDFKTVLTVLKPYIKVCRGMRANALATLFLTRRFHIIYSSMMGQGTQPFAFECISQSSPMMASITIEVDFTKLAGGSNPSAANFNPRVGLDRLQGFLEGFVQSQLTRQEGTTIRDLRILVRRYHGFRPRTTHEYTPLSHISQVLNPLKRLGPLVDSLTITGACKPFAMDLIQSFCGAGTEQELIDTHVSYRTPATEYPATPGQTSIVDYGPACPDCQSQSQGQIGLWLVRHGGDGQYHRSEPWNGTTTTPTTTTTSANNTDTIADEVGTVQVAQVPVLGENRKVSGSSRRVLPGLFRTETKKRVAGGDGEKEGSEGLKTRKKLDFKRRILSGAGKGLFGQY